ELDAVAAEFLDEGAADQADEGPEQHQASDHCAAGDELAAVLLRIMLAAYCAETSWGIPSGSSFPKEGIMSELSHCDLQPTTGAELLGAGFPADHPTAGVALPAGFPADPTAVAPQPLTLATADCDDQCRHQPDADRDSAPRLAGRTRRGQHFVAEPA